MIAWLKGVLLQKSPPNLILDVRGVGYVIEVSYVTFSQLPKVGEECTLHIYTLVREDALLLFGFSEIQEKQVFSELLKINGVGAKVALGILSGLSVQELMEIIQSKDISRLTSVPGIGKKTAERLLLEMADRFKGKLSVSLSSGEQSSDGQTKLADVHAALVALGYSANEADAMVRSLPTDEPDMGTADKVRWLLRRKY